MSGGRHGRGRTLLGIFALSGFAGLVYQSIWTHYLGLFLGHSAHAQSLVLMLFMGGMALGAWLVSRRSEALRRPLMAYAAIELLIGLLGIGFDPAYRAVTGWAYEGALQVPGLRWLLAIALVLPQCILLGATFPLMSAGYMRLQPDSQGRILAGLYFSNSIGAAVGALAATYLLVPRVGLPGAILTAGILNIVVAVAVYPPAKPALPAAMPRASASASRVSTPMLVLVVAALTGATSFVYEITWVRMLSMALGTTIHAFELMLASFIAGLAFGGLWLRQRADRLPSPLQTVGWVQVWMGLAALASMFVYANAFEWVGWLMRVITRTSEGYGLYTVASGAISLAVMFPAAFFAGMTLPLLTLVLIRQGGGERAIGRVYAVNTLGAIVGVLATVHLLLPMLGLKLALALAAAIDLAMGVVLLRAAWTGNAARWQMQPAAWAASFALAGLALALSSVTFDPRMLASSVYRHGTTRLGGDTRVLFHRDGKTASVAVYEQRRESGLLRSIATNGKVDAGLMTTQEAIASPDEYTMALLAALPLSMRDRFERVGVVGFGSGMTTHVLLGSDRVGRVDTVEIEPMMVEGARHFGERVRRAYQDPRSRVVIDDAKRYFSTAGNHYDLIVSEPSNPWMGGTASLFTDEFYAFVPRHLAPDGLFVQWLQLYEIDEALVSSVLQAMLPHFRDVHAYLANGTDLVLVASPRGPVPRAGDRVFNDQRLHDELQRLGIRNRRDLEDGFVMDRRALEAFTNLHPAPVNSDYFPVLQLRAPEARFTGRRVDFAAWQSAPWPVARHLGRIAARGAGEPPPVLARPFPLDGKQKAALELRSILVEGNAGPFTAASTTAVRQAQALRRLGMECRLDGDPAANIELLASLAAETVPFLDLEAQVPLWGQATWLACPPTEPLLVGGLSVLAAASAGDSQGVIAQGQRLLSQPADSAIMASKEASRYFSGALLFAAVAASRPEVADTFAKRDWARLPAVTREDPTLRLLWTLAAMKPPVP